MLSPGAVASLSSTDVLIVDSSVWIDYFRDLASPETDWLDRMIGIRSIGISDLILCEVLQGLRDDRSFAHVRRELARLFLYSAGGEQLAIAAAQNYRLLRSKGLTVRTTIYCFIATFCIETGHELLHRDRDFDAFETHLGLRVLHP